MIEETVGDALERLAKNKGDVKEAIEKVEAPEPQVEPKAKKKPRWGPWYDPRRYTYCKCGQPYLYAEDAKSCEEAKCATKDGLPNVSRWKRGPHKP